MLSGAGFLLFALKMLAKNGINNLFCCCFSLGIRSEKELTIYAHHDTYFQTSCICPSQEEGWLV